MTMNSAKSDAYSEVEMTTKRGRKRKPMGRPVKRLPKISATPEEAAKALIALPPDHKWEYPKENK